MIMKGIQMNRKEFYTKIEDIMDCESEITSDTEMSDIEEWDSLAIISTIAFLDSIGKKITAEELRKIKTAGELAELAGINE